jgi:hypothetical protein
MLFRIELDGTIDSVNLPDPTVANFHHDLAPGKTGLLAELDPLPGGVPHPGAVLAEIDTGGIRFRFPVCDRRGGGHGCRSLDVRAWARVICGHLLERVSGGQGGYVIDYASVDARAHARLIGLDVAGNVAFDYQYPTGPCETMFAAVPIGFDALVLDD